MSGREPAKLNTAFLLAAMYDGRPTIPLETVRADWFPHLTKDQFIRKLSCGDIRLPVMRIEASQKAPRTVHLCDLAIYLDDQRKEANLFMERLAG